ncbi:MAG: DUF6776 family protein [Porticoccaceae bacterium]|nr:hypothetical protein [Pseudomonadales bacterium]MCP5172794.1 hypothetical protein [Pseudomonadales bacterium]MCP5302268.1 hypothetical protein [Pseudomonadales bacterium]
MSVGEERLVVRTYSVRRQRIALVVRLTCLVAVFFLGLMLGGQMFEREMAAKRLLEKDVGQLNAMQDSLNQQLANAEAAVEIDRAALEQVRKTVVELQQQLADSEKELELYRNLMRDDSLPKGFSIWELSLTPLDEGGVAYRLVVINKAGALKPVEVFLQLSVEGEVEGVSKTVPLEELDEKLSSPLSMKFKYFGVLQGVMDLPPGFDPRLVHTSLWKKGQKKRVRKSFNWHSEET